MMDKETKVQVVVEVVEMQLPEVVVEAVGIQTAQEGLVVIRAALPVVETAVTNPLTVGTEGIVLAATLALAVIQMVAQTEELVAAVVVRRSATIAVCYMGQGEGQAELTRAKVLEFVWDGVVEMEVE
jgi:hypothetical protein